jgi:hypothetical protein
MRPGISGWAQVHGGKLVSKEEKEKLDEWYVRNASLWVDLQITLMTLKLVLTSHHEEAEADTQQVRGKNAPLEQNVGVANSFGGRAPRRAS